MVAPQEDHQAFALDVEALVLDAHRAIARADGHLDGPVPPPTPEQERRARAAVNAVLQGVSLQGREA